MRKSVMLLATLMILLIVFGDSIFGQEKYSPKPDEELYGTWTNPKGSLQKFVKASDGWKFYVHVADTSPYDKGTTEIESKWTDSDGNIWYRCFNTNMNGYKTQELDRLSKGGTVLEFVFRQVDEFDRNSYPNRIDPLDPNYGIYYRAKE